MNLRILQMWRADSSAVRMVEHRGVNSRRWGAQKTVCPRRLRQLSATATALWVVYSNQSKNRIQFESRHCFASFHTWIMPLKQPLPVILIHVLVSFCLVSCIFLCVFQSDLESDLNRTLSELEAEALTKSDSLQVGKHTMPVSNASFLRNKLIWAFPDSDTVWQLYDTIFLTSYHTSTCLFSLPNPFPSLAITWQIPRIILTHPSTSDEDVELLTQSPSREPLRDYDIPNRHANSDCFDSAFYPPWTQPRTAHMKNTDCY